MTERESVHAIHGRIGAIESWARMTKTERTRRTEAARQGLLERFAREADPDGRMTEAERVKAAEQLRRAHMMRLAQRSKEQRSKRSANGQNK